MGGAWEAARSIEAGERSSEQIVSKCLDRIARCEDLHAFISLDRERALACARKVDAARAGGSKVCSGTHPSGRLAGVPIAVKDNICATRGPTTCGSKILAPFHSQYDAHVVERLESAGAIIVGKTNLDEFAMGSSTEHSAFGPTLNPWDATRVAGGSSGGSAAAVAIRAVSAAIGSDTGGSIRQPAAFCGVVGLKPSYGRVSRYGLVAFGSSLDQIGPITTDVRDAALLLSVIAGHDKRDSTSVDAPVPDYVAGLDQPLSGLRIGISSEYFGQGLDPQVRDAVQAAIDLMRREGADVTSIDLPHLKYAVSCYYIIAPAEASSNLARFDGVHYGYRSAKPKDIIDLNAATRGESFGAEVKRRIMLGTYVLSSGYYDAYYLKALRVRTLVKRDFERAFENVDVIASPVAPSPAFRIGEKTGDPLAMYLGDIYTVSANLAGICAISLPCGFCSEGMPIGLQLMGPALGEEKLLAAAHQYQLRTDFHVKLPPHAAAD